MGVVEKPKQTGGNTYTDKEAKLMLEGFIKNELGIYLENAGLTLIVKDMAVFIDKEVQS